MIFIGEPEIHGGADGGSEQACAWSQPCESASFSKSFSLVIAGVADTVQAIWCACESLNFQRKMPDPLYLAFTPTINTKM